jgi:molybdopterin converting factor small subunit
LAGTVVVGVGLLLASKTLIGTELLENDAEEMAHSLVGPNGVTDGRASLITVKVYYSMMAQYIDLSDEYFVLQYPATLQNLIDTCVVRHPSVSQMVGTMMILLDGIPSKPSATLRDGDTIQFIPLSAGG